MFEDDVEAVDKALESALVTMDQAIAALHFSHNALTTTDRIKFGRQALHYFALVQVQLERLETNVRTTSSWRVWYNETRKGIASARKILETD